MEIRNYIVWWLSMYKFSIFFQFIFRDEKLIILFPENRYSLKINQEEQQKLEKFFYNFLDKNFFKNQIYLK